MKTSGHKKGERGEHTRIKNLCVSHSSRERENIDENSQQLNEQNESVTEECLAITNPANKG